MSNGTTGQRSRGEKIFLVALITTTLVSSIGFVLATALYGIGFPSTFVAILMALAIATLAYAFLGGVEGAVFQLGALRLAGAAAVIMVVVYAVKGPLAEDMRDARAIQLGRSAEERIRAEQEKMEEERRARQVAERRLAELEGQAGDAQMTSVSGIIARIRESEADQPLGRGILELFRRGQGPFDRVLSTVRLPVKFNAQVAPGTFQYCHSRRSEFNDHPVRFEIVDAEAGTSESITLEPGNDIGEGICSTIDFDVLLGCDAVRELLPTLTTGCDDRTGVAWVPPNTNRKYDVVASILNPALVPRSSIGSPAPRLHRGTLLSDDHRSNLRLAGDSEKRRVLGLAEKVDDERAEPRSGQIRRYLDSGFNRRSGARREPGASRKARSRLCRSQGLARCRGLSARSR